MEAPSDAADWAAALRGEGEAFGRVFDRHHDRIRRHCVRLVDETDDAADAVAVVFLEAWRLRERVRIVDGSVLPWLLVTATNVCRNQSRSARRYRAVLARLPAPEPTPDHAADDDSGEAVQALRTLSAADQHLLTLSVLEGYPERDIAATLGVPAGTVKSRLSRARQRFARALEHIRAVDARSGTTGTEYAHEHL
jgi:RNA polymerase sigma factor (sigma-70 family)